MQDNKFSFSCVVDRKEKFFKQADRWAKSLITIAKVQPSAIYIHIVSGDGFAAEIEQLQGLGINIVDIPPFDAQHPYCNKLRQLTTMQQVATEYVVMMDCDTVVTDSFNPPLNPASLVHAKPVDFAIPPQPALHAIFNAAGLPEPQWITSDLGLDTGHGITTDWNNCNGGIYIIRKAALCHLERLWHQAARWCIQNQHLFEPWVVNIDQVSFALAMCHAGLKVTHLDREWNFPTHIPHQKTEKCVPKVIHYHDEIDREGRLKKTGLPAADEKIEIVNQILGEQNPRVTQQYGENDIGVNQLFWAKNLSDEPELLMELAGLSRRQFGWFTKHTPRAFEYPWVAARLKKKIKHGAVLDIGAGVAPLPIYFAVAGARVFTVDSSEAVRSGSREDRKNWNEWGFFDYVVDHGGISSHNVDILSVTIPDSSLDAAYSVSVIEHMPAAIRKQLWPKLGSWVKPGGLLAVTVDLVPGSSDLWNYNSGVVVEDTAAHGDLRTMEDEIRAAGFILKKAEYLHDLPDCRVDVAMMLFIRS